MCGLFVDSFCVLMVLVCLFHGVGTGGGTLCHFSTVSFRLVREGISEVCTGFQVGGGMRSIISWNNGFISLLFCSGTRLPLFKKKEYCTSSWIRIKHMLPICTEQQTLNLSITYRPWWMNEWAWITLEAILIVWMTAARRKACPTTTLSTSKLAWIDWG
jgi:hypothetical protein